MQLKYYGHSCFSMTFSDGTVLVTDPFDSHITYPPCNAECSAALVSHHHGDHDCIETLKGNPVVIDRSGNHRIGSVTVSAIPSWHDHHGGAHRGSNLLFRVSGDGVTVAHLGDLGHLPTREQAEFLRGCDILLIPVGGNYTIDHAEAVQVIKTVEPHTAIAMHYRTSANSRFNSDTVEPFVADTSAVQLPRVIEVSAETIKTMPACAYMDYE